MLENLLKLSKKALIAVTLFSAIVNLLMLTVPIYTLQLYDRVLASQSADTLIYLCLIVIFCIGIYAFLEILRSRVLIEVSAWLDNKLSPTLFMRSVDRLLQGNRYGYEAQRDLATIKNFLKSPSAFIFLDLPWFPIFLIMMFVISGTLGVITLIGGIILFILAVFNQKVANQDLAEATKLFSKNTHSIDTMLNHAETIQAMGMMNHFFKKWFSNNTRVLAFQSESSYRIGFISGLSKFMRILIQIFILTIGAYLAMKGELTGGAMIAASIIAGRALAPMEQCISAWKEFFTAKEALKRIHYFLTLPILREKNISLPKAFGAIECDHVIYMPAGVQHPLLQEIHFKLSAGETLAIIGPSGAGKSTLARLLLGIFPTTRGTVRLDGANVYTWDREDFGLQAGYLPQDNGLIDGTIKDNIACLSAEYADEEVITAAKMANAHEMILRLPKSYDTFVNEFQLSGGQAKRVALARAFYKNPCFILLDEPETHLDAEGEAALLDAIQKIKSTHKTTLVIITRHVKLIQLMEKTLVLKDGKMLAFGNTGEILEKMKV